MDADLTLRQALGSPAFWLFALSSAMFGLVYSGISLFNQSILEQRGFDASTYHTVLVISTMLGLMANFGGGWLASRWPIQRLMGLGMAVLSAALLALPMVRSYTHVVAYGAAMGISGGVVTVVFFSVWGQVYGRTHLGKIQGAAQMMTVFASAVGPLLLAETLKRMGSYDSIFYGLAAVVTVLGIGAWFVPLPARGIRGRQLKEVKTHASETATGNLFDSYRGPGGLREKAPDVAGRARPEVSGNDERRHAGGPLHPAERREGRLDEEKYVIEKVSKLTGETWLFQSRMQYGGHDIPVPVPVVIKWAGDTPVITLTDLTIPRMGTYTARVLLYGDQYAGTWSATDHGGQMFGKIVHSR